MVLASNESVRNVYGVCRGVPDDVYFQRMQNVWMIISKPEFEISQNGSNPQWLRVLRCSYSMVDIKITNKKLAHMKSTMKKTKNGNVRIFN